MIVTDSRSVGPAIVPFSRALLGESSLFPDLICIVTADSTTASNVTWWASEQAPECVIAVLSQAALQVRERDPLRELDDAISRAFSGRNLYNEKRPVSGGQFFGRAQLLQGLERTLREGQHLGLFGLRRIGKTSVLRETKTRLERSLPGAVIPFIDLQRSDPDRPLDWVVQELRREISREGERRDATWLGGFEGDPPRSDHFGHVTSFIDALRQVLHETRQQGHRLIIVMDEIDVFLTYMRQRELDAGQLFRGLRALSQETDRVSLLLTGVNAVPFEQKRLGGADNPLFGLLTHNHVAPLSLRDCTEMIVRVGRRMLLEWHKVAAEELARDVGGHPYLARLAAAEVAESHASRPAVVSAASVKKRVQDLHVRQSAQIEGILGGLQSYYPDEMYLLQQMALGNTAWVREYITDDETAGQHLVDYGLVAKGLDGIRIPVVERWLRRYGT